MTVTPGLTGYHITAGDLTVKWDGALGNMLAVKLTRIAHYAPRVVFNCVKLYYRLRHPSRLLLLSDRGRPGKLRGVYRPSWKKVASERLMY